METKNTSSSCHSERSSCHSEGTRGIPLDQIAGNKTSKMDTSTQTSSSSPHPSPLLGGEGAKKNSKIFLPSPSRRRVGDEVWGFTLVELIVVITILAILGTISFISFQGFQSSARDSVRVSDMTNIQKGLDLYEIKSGSYPTPMSGTGYTGGLNGGTILTQGTVPGSLIGFSIANPIDPLTEIPYVYSVSGNGRYYQIGGELESPLSLTSLEKGVVADQRVFGIDQAYAGGPKIAIVKGNYTFDPSLPSLILVPSSYNTASGIFNPQVCFVIDGGKNTLSNCVEKKEEMSLKDFDSGLVGYWDMETTYMSGVIPYIKDSSGNGLDCKSHTGNILKDGLEGKAIQTYTGDLALSYNPNFSTGSIFSLSMLYKVNSLLPAPSYDPTLAPSSGIISLRGNNIDGSTYSISIYAYDGKLYHGLKIGTVGTSNTLENVDYYSWNLLTLTYEGTKYSIYNNGKLIYSSQSSNSNYAKFGSVRLGNGIYSGVTTNVNLLGDVDIDDMKLYNRALSDDEIKQQAKIAGF